MSELDDIKCEKCGSVDNLVSTIDMESIPIRKIYFCFKCILKQHEEKMEKFNERI